MRKPAMKKLLFHALLPAALLVPAVAFAESTSGEAYGTITPVYNGMGIPLLDSFYFRFTDDDHHLRHLSARPQSGGTIQLALNDANLDDEYFYHVSHRRWIGVGLVTGTFSDLCTGSCTRTITPPGEDYVFVIRGFRMYYSVDDHQVDEIGVAENDGELTVYFNDINKDDLFQWFVDYAWVPAEYFLSLGSVNGWVIDSAVEHTAIPTGMAVIRSFKFNFKFPNNPGGLGDNNLKE